jgi:hypothetical protein
MTNTEPVIELHDFRARQERLSREWRNGRSVISGDDLLNMPRTKPAHGDRWGDWMLNLEPADNPSLDYVGKWYRHNPYQICLSELQTWQGFNHWMHHLSEKDWGQESMGDFVKAVMDIVDLPWPG